MIQFVLARSISGQVLCVRQCDVESWPDRDLGYGFIKLPAFESEMLGGAIISGRKLTRDERDLMRHLALPLFPECEEINTEGDEWKQ